jgi:hypothetical protein
MKKFISIAVWLTALCAGQPAYPEKAAIMDATQQDIRAVQALIDRHFDIWNEQDPKQWPALFPLAYTEDFVVADYAGIASGYAGLAQLLQRVQGAHAGYSFTPNPAEWNHGIGRVTWSYGPQDQPRLISGEDIFTLRNGKLSGMHVFINKP